MADLTSAVQTSTTSQEEANATATLIGYYENCQITIDDLAMHIEVLDGEQMTTVKFDLGNRSADCPELTAEVWLELPEKHEFTIAKEEDMKVTIGDDRLSGEVEEKFVTATISGEYFAHVTVSPAGFECAMAMVEECTDVVVQYPCKAVLSKLSGVPAVNTELGPADTYNGVNGIIHTISWDLVDLWNCDLYAKYSVTDDAPEEPTFVEGELDWATLIEFSENDDVRELKTPTSYYDWTYNLALYHQDNELYAEASAEAVSPHPSCTLSGELSTELTLVNGKVQVDHQWTVDHSYTCVIEDVEANLYDEEFESIGVKVDDGEEVSMETAPDGLPDLVYANFPISVKSVLDITAGEAEKQLESTATIWPSCEFSPISLSAEHEILQGEEVQNSFTPKISHSVGPYCPPMNGVIKITKDGEAFTTKNVPADIMEKTIEPTVLDAIDVAFGVGKYCGVFEMTPSQGNESGEVNSKTSEPVCVEVIAPACELTADNKLSKNVDHSERSLTYTSDVSVSQNSWCDYGVLDYTFYVKKNEGEWVDTNLDGDSMKFVDEMDDQDIHYQTKLVYTFTESIYEQKD